MVIFTQTSATTCATSFNSQALTRHNAENETYRNENPLPLLTLVRQDAHMEEDDYEVETRSTCHDTDSTSDLIMESRKMRSPVFGL